MSERRDFLQAGLHPDDPALARAVRRLALNRPRPTTEHAAEARAIVHRGLRHVILQLALADQKLELERQWANSTLDMQQLAVAWSTEALPASWREKPCSQGKVRFKRESDVLEFLQTLQRSGRGKGEVAVYWHTECGAWHHGRTPGKREGKMTIKRFTW